MVYITDAGNSRIRKIDVLANAISTIAGSGIFGFGGDSWSPDMCSMSHPVDIVGDGEGNLYICDRENSRIRVIKEKNSGTPISRTQ